ADLGSQVKRIAAEGNEIGIAAHGDGAEPVLEAEQLRWSGSDGRQACFRRQAETGSKACLVEQAAAGEREGDFVFVGNAGEIQNCLRTFRTTAWRSAEWAEQHGHLRRGDLRGQLVRLLASGKSHVHGKLLLEAESGYQVAICPADANNWASAGQHLP